MKKLILELTKGQKQEIQFLNWKSAQEGGFRSQFYGINQERKVVVVTLQPPQAKGAFWYREPFPECAVSGITPAALIPPPVRATKAEASCLEAFGRSLEHRGCNSFQHVQEAYRKFADQRGLTQYQVPAGWELAWVATDRPVLWLEPALEPALAERGGSLTGFLQEQWAEASGLTLDGIDKEGRAFELWVRRRMVNRPAEHDFFLPADKWLNWRALVTCAVGFEDGSGAYLFGVAPPRDPMADELGEVAVLMGKAGGLAESEVIQKLDTHHAKTIFAIKKGQEKIEKQVAAHREEDSTAHKATRDDLSLLEKVPLAVDRILENQKHEAASRSEDRVALPEKRPKKKTRKRGRKREYNQKDDQRLLDGWNQGHSDGTFRTYAEYAREKSITVAELVRAIQRARANVRYAKRCSEKPVNGF